MPSDRVIRVMLLVYGVSLGITGAWAAAAPRSFYDDFPGFGRHWVAVEGEPYNEHLVRDVGTLNLALAALTIAAAVWLVRALVQVAAAANLINALPHTLYHTVQLDKLETADQIGNMVTLGLSVVVPIVVLVLITRQPATSR